MDDINTIDVKQLEKSFLNSDAELSASRSIIFYLEQENKHLRQVIEMFITLKSPTI